MNPAGASGESAGDAGANPADDLLHGDGCPWCAGVDLTLAVEKALARAGNANTFLAELRRQGFDVVARPRLGVVDVPRQYGMASGNPPKVPS